MDVAPDGYDGDIVTSNVGADYSTEASVSTVPSSHLHVSAPMAFDSEMGAESGTYSGMPEWTGMEEHAMEDADADADAGLTSMAAVQQDADVSAGCDAQHQIESTMEEYPRPEAEGSGEGASGDGVMGYAEGILDGEMQDAGYSESTVAEHPDGPADGESGATIGPGGDEAVCEDEVATIPGYTTNIDAPETHRAAAESSAPEVGSSEADVVAYPLSHSASQSDDDTAEAHTSHSLARRPSENALQTQQSEPATAGVLQAPGSPVTEEGQAADLQENVGAESPNGPHLEAQALPAAAQPYEEVPSGTAHDEEYRSARPGEVLPIQPGDGEAKVIGHAELPPIRVTFNGQDFVMFPDAEPSCFLAAFDHVDARSATPGRRVEAVSAPQLAANAKAFHESLETLFDCLRVQESLGDFLDEGTELRLHFVDLDMEVREDDVYAREVTLNDMHRLHEGLSLDTSLHIVVSEGKRFIARYNELATHVANLSERSTSVEHPNAQLEQSRQASFFLSNSEQKHAKMSASSESNNVEAVAPETPPMLPVRGAAEDQQHHAEDEPDEAPQNSYDEDHGTDGKADETFVTVAEGDDDQVSNTERTDAALGSVATTVLQGQAGSQDSIKDEDSDADADGEEDEGDEGQYEEGIEDEEGEAVEEHAPAQSTQEPLEQPEEEAIVEYDEAYEQQSPAANGEVEAPRDGAQNIVGPTGESAAGDAAYENDESAFHSKATESSSVQSPSNKRPLDASVDEDSGVIYTETSSVAEADPKRARYVEPET